MNNQLPKLKKPRITHSSLKPKRKRKKRRKRKKKLSRKEAKKHKEHMKVLFRKFRDLLLEKIRSINK